jgi:hypothetical protein
MTRGNTARRTDALDASVDAAPAAPRCLSCGLPIRDWDRVFRVRGSAVHLRCAVYRRRQLRG